MMSLLILGLQVTTNLELVLVLVDHLAEALQQMEGETMQAQTPILADPLRLAGRICVAAAADSADGWAGPALEIAQHENVAAHYVAVGQYHALEGGRCCPVIGTPSNGVTEHFLVLVVPSQWRTERGTHAVLQQQVLVPHLMVLRH